MSSYLDYNGLSLYDRNIKKRERDTYYNKDEIDNLVAGLENNMIWKGAVATYSDLATTYPYPELGWTVNVTDANETYRYDGDQWVKIFASVIPKASISNDGLLSKELFNTISGYGTAVNRNYTTAVDTSANLPTAKAVNTYVSDALSQLTIALQAEIATKVNTDDTGSSINKNYTDIIPEDSTYIAIKGDWYCRGDNESFYLEGNGVNGGIDITFFQQMNNYTLHFNMNNYSNSVTPSLIVSGTINGEQVTRTYSEGAILSYEDIPDEYKAGTDSAELVISIDNSETGKIVPLDLLIYPVFHDELNNTDVSLINDEVYEDGYTIREETVGANVYTVIGTFGMYSSMDLPTASAVSSLVKTITSVLEQSLNNRIDEVEDKIDNFDEASDDEIEDLFGSMFG